VHFVRGGTFRREPSNKKIGFIYTRYTPFIGVFVESDSLRIMRISLIVMLGASLFSAAFAELCTDGICVSDADSEDTR
jgi:hypothetical protein